VWCGFVSVKSHMGCGGEENGRRGGLWWGRKMVDVVEEDSLKGDAHNLYNRCGVVCDTAYAKGRVTSVT